MAISLELGTIVHVLALFLLFLSQKSAEIFGSDDQTHGKTQTCADEFVPRQFR